MKATSNPEQENAQFGAARAIGIHHIEGFGVFGPDNSLEPCSHIHKLSIGTATTLIIIIGPWLGPGTSTTNTTFWKHPCAHRDCPNKAQNLQIALRANPLDCIACPPPIAVHRPDGLREELPSGLGTFALESYPDEPGSHLFDEAVGGCRQFEEQDGLGSRVFLHREEYMAFPKAEEGSSYSVSEGGSIGSAHGYG